MSDLLDLALRLILAPFDLWRLVQGWRSSRIERERRVRLEVLEANRRLEQLDKP
jgi:hypothetical protein